MAPTAALINAISVSAAMVFPLLLDCLDSAGNYKPPAMPSQINPPFIDGGSVMAENNGTEKTEISVEKVLWYTQENADEWAFAQKTGKKYNEVPERNFRYPFVRGEPYDRRYV